jgi:predicted acylesterase/phospholipase RssA
VKYDLVFEGGGAKGFGFIGALQALEQSNHTTGRLIGTSAGSVIATLLATGYTPDEMRELVREKVVIDGQERSRLSTFLDPPDVLRSGDSGIKDEELARALRHFPVLESHLLRRIPLYAHLLSFLDSGGWYAGECFKSWLKEKLDHKSQSKKIKYSECTLQQFYEDTQTDLSLVASDTSEGEMLVLNHRTAPKCPLIAAVRMSMSFPFIWQEVIWQQEWGTYRNRSKTTHIIADGGLLSNFPIHLLTRPHAQSYIEKIMGPDDAATDVGLMGLLLDHNRALDTANTLELPPHANLGFLHRPMQLLNTALGAYDFDFIQDNDAFICRIPVQGYSVIDFDLTDFRLDALMSSGFNAMINHLEKTPAKPFSPMQKSLGAS